MIIILQVLIVALHLIGVTLLFLINKKIGKLTCSNIEVDNQKEKSTSQNLNKSNNYQKIEWATGFNPIEQNKKGKK